MGRVDQVNHGDVQEMKLVQDWKQAWKWHSTQLMAVAAMLPLVWVQLPPDFKAMIPDAWMPFILPFIAIGAIVGRLRDQGN